MLAELDWVVASLHQAFDKNPTERIMSAMEHPRVHCIGHPTARKINKRGPGRRRHRARDREGARDEDVPRAELAAGPARPARRRTRGRAGEAGLKVPVNTDAHELRALDWMEIGIAQARRAWLTKEHVLNTRTWKQIEKLKKKPGLGSNCPPPPDDQESEQLGGDRERTTTSAASPIPRGPSSETTPTRTPNSISSSARNASRSVESSPA